ncbi:leucyl aminopeptidase [Euzebya tangerina]|uniref:leucyl aminopeptidase n=1 Tax=Euzebya tangerina TaxID=591198 RepID=UPI000E30D1FC|nr:leucyl aminopeptidase [Euzebya tangerina]
MITISTTTADLTDLDTDALVVGVFKGGIEGPGASEALAALDLDDFPVTPDFRGDVGQTLRLAAPGQPFGSLLLVGLGRMDAISPAALRLAAGEALRALPSVQRVATTLAQVNPTRASIEAVADGLVLGGYRDTRFTSATDDSGPTAAQLLVPSSLLAEADAAIGRSRIVCTGVSLARDMVNTPPGLAGPQALADMTRDAMPSTVDVQVHGMDWLVERGCGGLLQVGRGSDSDPCLVELTYEPESPVAHVVLAGKGITFDTGGLNLKPPTGMPDMKSDMGGAAAVAGALQIVGALGGRVKVTGLLAFAENAIGADAGRPSDVLTTFDGTTVEVMHTDAEGRLVLADALGYGASMHPDVMVDVATLTGAVVVALGPYQAGLMGNDQRVVGDLTQAAQVAGESLWHLPLPADLDRWLESEVADVRNLGGTGPEAGSLTAGLFLQRFVGDTPWAHLDIAGPAFLSSERARGHQPAGGTGFGVSTLAAFVEAQLT